jgi:general secretion pathway protein C
MVGIDAQLRRYFPLVVCGLLGGAAYLQASGMGELVASRVGGVAPKPAEDPAWRPAPERPPDGTPILARNPFDSTTGPLDGRDVPEDDEDLAPPASMPSGQPGADAPKCDFGRVLLIAAGEDPSWSFAALEGRGGGGSKLRRVGDSFEGHTVEAMGWDRVWLTGSGSRCQMEVGDKSNAPAPKSPGRSTLKADNEKRGGSTRGVLPPELASKIQKTGENQFTVDRSLVDEIVERQGELMSALRIKPIKDGDRTTGLEVSRVREGSLLGLLGVQNGDQLRTINGFELSDPQRALEAYGRLRTADSLRIELMRNGQPVNIDVSIR